MWSTKNKSSLHKYEQHPLDCDSVTAPASSRSRKMHKF